MKSIQGKRASDEKRKNEQELAIKREKMQLQRKQVEIQHNQKEIMDITKREQDLIFYNSVIDPNLPEMNFSTLRQESRNATSLQVRLLVFNKCCHV